MGYRGLGIKMARGKWLIPHAIPLLQVARLMARPPVRAHAAPGTYLTAIYLMGESSSLDSLFNPDPIVGLHPLLPVPFLYRLY
jgi:hypothetical protein